MYKRTLRGLGIRVLRRCTTTSHQPFPSAAVLAVCIGALVASPWTSCFADDLQVFHDGVFYTMSDSNSVFIVMQNTEPRQSAQLTIAYDPELLVLKNVHAAGRLVPDVEVFYSDTGDRRIRLVVVDTGEARSSIRDGSDAIVDLQFALTMAAQPDMQTTISITNATAATEAIPPQMVSEMTWNELVVDIAVGVEDGPPPVVGRNALYPNAPNPFNPVTSIKFEVATRGRVQLRVYDIAGRLVCRLVDEVLEPGVHAIPWYGRDDRDRAVASGVYLYRLDVGGYSAVKKMTILK